MSKKKVTTVNPLKFFNDALEFRRMAMGGSMMNMPTNMNIISSDTEDEGVEGASSMDSDNPAKRRRQQARQQRQMRRGKPNRRRCRRQRVRADGTIECLEYENESV